MSASPFLYKGTILLAVDGDTLDVRVDLGFRIFHEMRLRIYGVNTPERGQPGYSEARDFLLPFVGKEAIITSHKPQDKYGRWLAEVSVDGVSLADSLIAQKLGVPYFGGKRGEA